MNEMKRMTPKSKEPFIFLGGTCNESTWRSKIEAEVKNIKLFNPVVDDWNEEAQKREIEARKTCTACLYVITPKMTGVYSIAEVVDDSNKQPWKTMFCWLEKDGDNEFDKHQRKSLMQVEKMVSENGARTFDDLDEVIKFLKEL
jgi:hypothetical protein